MKRKTKGGVFAAIRTAAAGHKLLSTGTILCAAASVLASLLPPLLLGRIIDTLTGGTPLVFTAALLYFGSLALEGVLSSAQKTLMEIFGQKMAHALRSELSAKLTRLPAAVLAAQDPGEVAARFSGDVDTAEALFTSGVISMAADACRILSILAVIAVKDPGLALVLLLVLPLLTVFTRHVQKRMLAAQLDNRRAVAAISGQVPEALHNIRTIRALGLEDYMTRRYDRRIGESYAAVERTNFYDVIYSPVVLVLSAAVVGTVMLLSASGDPHILKLFGMSVGTSVTIIDYISRIFTPIESLGMEIQTIQSAMAGVKRISRAMAERAARLAGLDEVIRTLPSGYDTPCADGLFSRGGSGSFCPSRGQQRRTPPFCCLTRSPPIWTPRLKRAYWKRCAARPKVARCSPSPTASTKASAAEPSISSRKTAGSAANDPQRLLNRSCPAAPFIGLTVVALDLLFRRDTAPPVTGSSPLRISSAPRESRGGQWRPSPLHARAGSFRRGLRCRTRSQRTGSSCAARRSCCRRESRRRCCSCARHPWSRGRR